MTPDEPYDIHDYSEDTINDAYLREAARTAARAAAVLLVTIIAMAAQVVLFIVGLVHLDGLGALLVTAAGLPFTIRVIHRFRKVRRNHPGLTFSEALHEESKTNRPDKGLLGWALMLPFTIVAGYGAVCLWGTTVGLAVGLAILLVDLGYRWWSNRGGRRMAALARMQQGGDKNTWEA